MALTHEEQANIIKTGLGVCDLCESLVTAIRRGGEVEPTLKTIEKALPILRAELDQRLNTLRGFLTEDEQNLVDQYRRLNDISQEAVRRLVSVLPGFELNLRH